MAVGDRPHRRTVRARARAARAAALGLAALALTAGSCAREPTEEPLLVFAASSLRDALSEVGRLFGERTGTPVDFNFAGSNVLAQQLLAAPEADLFLSANEAWMDRVESAGLLAAGTRRPFLSNRLVVVAHRDSPLRLAALSDLAAADFRHLALGDPDAVPAGLYARELLISVETAGGSLWDRLRDRVVAAPNVRAALGLVEAIPDTVAIVYASDVAAAGGARTLLEVPAELTPGIRYVAAAIAGRPRSAEAGAFLEFLSDPRAVATFAAHGFSPLP